MSLMIIILALPTILLSSNLLPRNIDVSAIAVKYNSSSMFLTPITDMEVVGIIKELGNKKSMGIDDISEYIIKKCYPKIITVLTHIVNLSFSAGCFPDQLKITKVKPLYKKESDTDVVNYRPVSLISVFSKIIEKIMHKKLFYHF
jgi:hypothetical protein